MNTRSGHQRWAEGVYNLYFKPFEPGRPGYLLVTILVAGLLAGLTAAIFHAVVTEPLIDQAIALEEMRHTEPVDSEPVVSRAIQKIGLFIGWAALGLTFAIFLGGAYNLAFARGWVVPGWLPPVLFAAAGFCAFALLPGLKYPAHPPGVGSPETIDFRQQAFVTCWVLGIAGAVIAALVSQRTIRAGAPRLVLGAVLFAAWSVGVFVALPANPDPVTMPAALVGEFRARSLIGLTLFWLVLGACFTWAASRPSPAPARLAPRSAS